MINILLEGFDIDAPWLYDELKNYIKPNLSVAVVAFSFRDNRVKSLSDWNALYTKGCGKYHDGIVGGLRRMVSPKKMLVLSITLLIQRKLLRRKSKRLTLFISSVDYPTE